MYQPAFVSSPAKLLLGCISIAISQSNTTPILDHSGPIFRRLVCRSPQIQFLRAASSLLYLNVRAITLMKRQIRHATKTVD